MTKQEGVDALAGTAAVVHCIVAPPHQIAHRLVFFLGLLLLLVLLMGVFCSFLLPLPILVAIPLAIIGSLWGLLLLQKPMCMPAMMGIVLLAGTVMTLVITPVTYTLLDDATRLGARR